jgi:glucoside 3-dehydrogenase (cytochrome c) hitch-hiker subunit
MADVNRREALRKIAVGGAAAATAPFWVESLASAAEQHAAHYQAKVTRTTKWAPKALTAAQNDTVVALAELIIPQTETAGATKANVNQFIDAVLVDASPDDRRKFVDGLAWVEARSQRDAGAPFVKATPAQQTALLTALSTAKSPTPDDQAGVDFFKAIKALTITGYYTSEIGMREEMGDDGNLFFLEFKGCMHPQHKT